VSSRRLPATVGVLAGVALLIGASWSAAHPTATDAKGGVLRVARFEDVDYVDPALAYTSWSWALLHPTCARLFNLPDRPGADGARVVPEVVRRQTVTDGGRTYTFELKRTFHFHTGAPVTARSFADAFNRVADPRMRSPGAGFLREVVGADAVLEGKARTIAGVRVLGPYRLEIRLTRPVGDLTARLTMLFFCPVLPNTPIDPRGIDEPAGSGPYYVADRVVNQRIVLRRNPYYRGNRPANVDQIVYTAGVTPEDCLAATEDDRVDLCLGVEAIPDTANRRLAAKYGVNRAGGRYFVAPVLSVFAFAFNHDRPAFAGREQIPLAKAINYAIDRHALARVVGVLAGRRTDGILPPSLGGTGHIYPIAGPDLVAARRWSKRARLVPRELVLYAYSSSLGVGFAQVFAFNLKQIGIDVTVKYFDLESLVQKARTRGEPYDVVFQPWTVDYPDPASFFVLLQSESIGDLNWANLDDPSVDARIDAANRLTGAARRKAWSDLDADLMRNSPPWAPFLHRNQRTFVSKTVGCFFLHPVYREDLAAICKK
jgi:peptide/nickel transport system substrate-binding protein/oligopeptide transport system substrate-binding protein